MGNKRRHSPRDTAQSRPQKRVKTPEKRELKGKAKLLEPDSTTTAHPVLSCYYPRVIKLRSYLLELLPPTSKSRRRKVASLGTQSNIADCARSTTSTADVLRVGQSQSQEAEREDTRIRDIAKLLDTTLVGVLKPSDHAESQPRQRDFAAFTQSQFRSSLLHCTDVGATSSLSEIVDFTILTLFNQHRGPYSRPPHLLCHGFQRASSHCARNREHGALAGIPGVVPQYPNKNVSMLKGFPWTDVLNLLGANCEEIMLHLLLDCGLFISLDSNKGTYYQLSGIQLIDLKTIDVAASDENGPSKENENVKGVAIRAEKALLSPKNIIFVRTRVLYARPALNARGEAKLGLQHIHVLNRYPDSKNLDHTVHIMKYIFPRQFGLHNVFTSIVDPKTTSQALMDYTLREEEIAKSRRAGTSKQNPNKLPKRLRGEVVTLIQKLQKRHQRCSYVELLRHYCPVDGPPPAESQQSGSSMTNFATPMAAVSAFCQAVLQKLIPNDLLGVGQDGRRNREIVMRQVDAFVRLRRFESLSLHEATQGLKITCVGWLKPRQTKHGSSHKLCLSDKQKRFEVFLEFIYYIFDSLLIPLIRSNFYVTETNVHRNRLFYFRHDIWKKLVEPLIVQLKTSVFEEVKKAAASKILSRRAQGYGTLRILPKRSGARPIVNLSKRPVAKSKWNARVDMGPSINMLLAPVFQVLNYEKGLKSELMGSAMASVGDMHIRLKTFREKLSHRGTNGQNQLYFVKLDVQACFDTIPQRRLLRLMEDVIPEDEYRVSKYVEVGTLHQQILVGQQDGKPFKPVRKFVSKAAALLDFKGPYDFVVDQSNLAMKRDTVFIDTGYQKRHETDDLLAMLEEHVRNNLVRIGKKYFRQKNGIPQGSVVSSILCNFFYGEHERTELGFLDCDEALLLRLIDDYLLITTEKDLATRFLQVMLDGNPEYGISVTPGKTLVNFDVEIRGCKIPQLDVPSRNQFPYCGSLIDTRTLAISKDRTRRQEDLHVCDSLTVEVKKAPGQAFQRKALSALKLQMHTMFLDTKHNPPTVVLTGIYHAFVDSAMRMYAYYRSLSRRHRRGLAGPWSAELFTRTIAALIEYAVHRVQTSGRRDGFECQVTNAQVRWLAVQAFRAVLGKKQSRFGGTIRWLESMGRVCRPVGDEAMGKLLKVVRDGRGMMQNYRY